MATAQGPASGNGVVLAYSQGNQAGAGAFAPTTGVEVQVPNGLPSLEPSRAPFVDPSALAYNVNSQTITPINTTFVMGTTGATIRFSNPA
jgi:hypothetical protein